MKIATHKTHFPLRQGFTLVMTLSILAAVTILVVGLFSIVSRERQTSTSFDAVEQADLAVQAGLENAGAMLKEALRDENGLILTVPTAPWITGLDVANDPDDIVQAEEGKAEAATLMAVRRKLELGGLSSFAWTYTPLVSGAMGSEAVQNQPTHPELVNLRLLPRPVMPGTYQNGQPTFQNLPVKANATPEQTLELKRAAQRAASVSPWRRTPSMYWVELKRPKSEFDPADGDSEIAARFAFYVEDLQGELPLATAGNYEPISGLHERTPFTFPPQLPSAMPARERDLTRWMATVVPGLNLRRPELPLLAETSLHTFFQPNVEPMRDSPILDDVLNRMHKVMLRNQALQFSPENWRETLMQPDPMSSWQGLQASALQERDTTTGSLTNPVMRRLEEQTAAGLLPYEELALIPPDPAFASLERYTNPADPLTFVEGPARKLNLNRVLNEIETETNVEIRQQKARAGVDLIATHIQNHLPHFAGISAGATNPNQLGRKGGYPLPLGGTNPQKARAYLQCLAAGMIDYADTDSVPTMDGDPMLKPEDDNGTKNGSQQWHDHYPRYRGMDAYPVVSKQWQRYRLEGTESAEGASFAVFSVTHYLEIWNMTNQVISGEITAAYEVNGYIPAGFRQYDLMACLSGNVNGAAIVSGKPLDGSKPDEGLPDLRRPSQKLAGWWHQPIRMNDTSAPDADARVMPFIQRGMMPPTFKPMQPNEVRVIAFAPVVYRLNIGSSGGSSASVTFTGLDSGSDLRSRYRIAFKPNGTAGYIVVDQPLQPADRLNRNVTDSAKQRFNLGIPGLSYGRGGQYLNAIGDPRGGFFINFNQDYVNYENGSSPWARTVRDNIKTREYGQTRVHLWPDGGHISRGPKQGTISLNTNPDDKSLVPSWHAAKPGTMAERQKYVQHLSSAGRFFSVTELGHVFDPIMWDPNGGSEFTASGASPNNTFYREFANLLPGLGGNKPAPSDKFCGGNTLRIGRPEHERFRPDYTLPPATGRPSLRSLSATALLDLFHCGQPRAGMQAGAPSAEELAQIAGDLVRIHGHVNLNTASRDTLRALAAGRLVMDPRLRRRLTSADEDAAAAAPTLNESMLHPPSSNANAAQADLLAELIIRNRPYITPAELAEKVLMPTAEQLQSRPLPHDMLVETNQPGVVLEEGQPVLGATRRANDRVIEPEWNDAAAEETFARIFNNATVRSRNFRIIVTGQSVRRSRSGETQVLATRSRLYHVFIRPIRDLNGNLIRQQTEITYARTL